MEAMCLAWPGRRQMHLSGEGKGKCGASGGRIGLETCGGREQRMNLLPGESWPVFEVLVSSRRVNWSAPGSYLGPGPCREVTWPYPRQPAWEGGPRTCGPGLPRASPELSCQCQGASSTSLAKLPRAICQHVGAPCVSGRVFVELESLFQNGPGKGKECSLQRPDSLG